MKKLNIIYVIMLPILIVAGQRNVIKLNGLKFTNPKPGVFVQDYQSKATKSIKEMPNYYMRMAFFTGTKNNIISGNGNEKLRNISEWRYNEGSKYIDTTDIMKQKILIYNSSFHDANEMIGHNNVGINVNEKIYKLQDSDAIIFEYEVEPENNKDGIITGCYFDFDIPDMNNNSNPNNDMVNIDSKYNFIYMANQGKPTTSAVPTILPLSSDISYYVYDVEEATYVDKKIGRRLVKTKNKKRKYNSKKSDYRFMMYKKDQEVDKSGSIKFAFVLFHSYGKKSIRTMTSELDEYTMKFPKLSKKSDKKDIRNISTPESFILSENYPNPFNPTTKFRVSVPEQTKLNVAIYDISG